MIDFHCHLDLYQDAKALLPLVAKRNQFTLSVTTSPRAWIIASRLFSGYGNIKVALGLHPEVAAQKSSELPLLLSSIPKAMFVGEIGIDGSSVYKDLFSIQESIFKQTLMECERMGGRILSIHSRNAVRSVLNLIERYCIYNIPVLHWFTGTAKEAKYALELGCWFSVGPAMISGSKGRTLLNELPINRILPETDGPFASYCSKTLMPWDAFKIIDSLAESHGMTKEEIHGELEKNLFTILTDMKTS